MSNQATKNTLIGIGVIAVVIFSILLVNIVGGNKKETSSNQETKTKEDAKRVNQLDDGSIMIDTTAEEPSKPRDPSGTKYSNIKEISFTDFKQKVNKKETFIVVFTQTTCGHCYEYKPVLNQVLVDNKLTVYEINLKALTADEVQELRKYTEVTYTPLTAFYKKGKETSANDRLGNVNKEIIIEALKKHKYIK